MKPRLALLVAMLLILPLILAACGSTAANNAEKFLQAADDNDREEAQKYTCDKNKEELTNGIDEDNTGNIKEVSCEEDGDDVKCEITIENDGEEIEATVIFGMEDDKVCEIKSYED